MHSRIDFTLFATVSCWSEIAPYSDNPDPFQSVVFQGRVSDYTSPNLLSGSHMHNFAFGCTKRLFSQTCLICRVTQPALYKCFSLIISIPPGFIISAYFISSEFISTCRAMMKMLNRTESKIHPNIISMILQSSVDMALLCFALHPAYRLGWTIFFSFMLKWSCCPTFLSVNGSLTGIKIQHCPSSKYYTWRSIQWETNLRNQAEFTFGIYILYTFIPVQ